jgi:hypothetical protein
MWEAKVQSQNFNMKSGDRDPFSEEGVKNKKPVWLENKTSNSDVHIYE